MDPEEIEDPTTPAGYLARVILQRYHWLEIHEGKPIEQTTLMTSTEAGGKGVTLSKSNDILENATRLGITQDLEKFIHSVAMQVAEKPNN